MKQRINLARLDSGLLGAVLLLVIVGIFLVFDASYAPLSDSGQSWWTTMARQAIWGCVGLAAMWLASKVSFAFMRKWFRVAVVLSFVLLVIVLIPGIGVWRNGARSWFEIGPILLQPSEIVKIIVILLLAAGLSRARVFARRRPRVWVTPLLIACALIALIALERDLGTAAVTAGTCFFMFYAAGARKRYVLGTGIAMLVLGALVMTNVPHVKARVDAFRDPWSDQYGKGFQTVHSLIALGTGGLTGQGYCEGREKLYVPEPYTDYIFSSTVGEELGFLGSIALLGLFGFVVYRGLDIARRSKSTYGNLLAVGLTTMIGLQAIINIAVVTNSIPATGIPLPFVSYGGSSLVSMMIATGLLLSVSRQVNVELE